MRAAPCSDPLGLVRRVAHIHHGARVKVGTAYLHGHAVTGFDEHKIVDHWLGTKAAVKRGPLVCSIDGYWPADTSVVKFDLDLLIPIPCLPQAHHIGRSPAETDSNLTLVEAKSTAGDGDDVACLPVIR